MDLEALAACELAGVDGTIHRVGDLWADRRTVVVFLRHFG